MPSKKIIKEFLLLLSGNWDDPEVHIGFKALREQVSGQGEWASILDARLLTLEGKTAQAVSILEDVLGTKSADHAASLMLACILNRDAYNFGKALDVLNLTLIKGFKGQVFPDWFEVMALNEKVYALARQKRWEEAFETADGLLDRFEASRKSFFAGQVARALVYKGVTIGKLGKPEEELRVYDDIERRFGEDTEPGIQEQVAKALVNKGITFGRLGKLKAGLRIHNDIVRRFGAATMPGIRGQVARALVNKGWILAQQGKPEKALRVYDDIERRFGEDTELGIREPAARALANKGLALGKLGKREEELRVYDDIERRFGEDTEPDIRGQVARALVNKGWTLAEQSKPEEAIRAYDDIGRRFGEDTEPGIRGQVARALVNKGVILGKLGKPEEELRTYDEVERRFGEDTEPNIKVQVARALLYKGLAFGQQGKVEEKLQSYDEIERRFGEDTEPSIQEQVARALVNKAVTLGKLGKPEEQLRTYDDIERRFGAATERGIRETVARALVYKGWLLAKQGKPKEAIRVYDRVEKKFTGSQSLSLRKWYFEAKLRKSLNLLQMGTVEKASLLFSSIQNQLRLEENIKKDLASLYTSVSRHFASEISRTDAVQSQERMNHDLEITIDTPDAYLEMILSHVLEEIDHETQKTYFDTIELSRSKTDRFITDESCFSDEFSFLLVLREWNSYTPTIPSAEESDRGGGYYIRHAGQGIVIDPGYDFISNFHRAGGRLNGIDHIVVTHAHDDHTAELESILMLLHRRRNNTKLRQKCINLYLSLGVQRKFSGLLDLRDPLYGEVVTLSPSTNQRIKINEKTTLTVLTAFHDDVITRDSAVGLGFEFDTAKGKRKVIFTGDSGFYPRKRSPDGKDMYYDQNETDEKAPMLDVTPDNALFERYPEEFRNCPHLVVAHIGSIKEQEFGKGNIPSPGEVGRRFYPNHLGLLGTLMLLDALHPDAAIVSEFGAELKGFHIDLVQKLGKALNRVKKDDAKETLMIAGDLTTVYDITNHLFLSHTQLKDGSFKFMEIDNLTCRKAADFLYSPKWNYEIDVSEKTGSERAYLFIKDDPMQNDDLNAKHFAESFFGRKLPYQKNPVRNGDEL